MIKRLKKRFDVVSLIKQLFQRRFCLCFHKKKSDVEKQSQHQAHHVKSNLQSWWCFMSTDIRIILLFWFCSFHVALG